MNIIKQLETRVWRTYRGGMLLEKFLGKNNPTDSFYPEDWISSFVQAKNKNYMESEGITRVICNGEEKLITNVVENNMFGAGRETSGVLIKLLDSSERLSIQVHPDKKCAVKLFSSPFGKTECWHILDTRDENACIYLGFKEGITRKYWKELFDTQNIDGMLDAMHCFKVKKGDTILVKGGVPHAIGAGCFLLEIQEPTDYTMRMEKVTLAGDVLTDMQLHYGVGVENMLECFNYNGKSAEQTREEYFLKQKGIHLVDYDDTKCFKLDKITENTIIKSDCFYTVVIIEGEGYINDIKAKKGDKFFVPAQCENVILKDVEALICYPPQKEN